MQTIEADYLVVGAGAMGMAFVDTLVTETDATVVVVDRNEKPGGHWRRAYPFVRLHQPSAYYGVNSRRLGSDSIDTGGWNEGFYELAGGSEICAYYDAVLAEQLLPSGRVSYFPLSEYLGDNHFRTLAGDGYRVDVRRRTVDATYLSVVVPSMRPPPYDVAAGVTCIPPNGLPRQAVRDRYVIVGAGKTAMDACLWLLRHDVPAEQITWIKPRDSWLLDRASVQPGPLFARRVLADFSAQWRAINAAESVHDLFDRLADRGCLLRIDESVTPTMYRCAIVSQGELERLRTITDVVRMGHVVALEPARIVLEDGVLATDPDAVHVDCTGDGVRHRAAIPVFAGDHVTLQSVRTCQPTFSAAVTARIEAMNADDDVKNDYCQPVPHPTNPLDWITMTIAFNHNQLRWFDDPDLMSWLNGARLNAASHMQAGDDAARDALVQIAPRLRAAGAKLEALLARR